MSGSSSHSKFWLMVSAVILVFVLFTGRAFQLQLLRSEVYTMWKEEKYLRKYELKAPRGLIYDRNGKILAQNILKYELYCDPQTRNFQQHQREIAEFFQKYFPAKYGEIRGKIALRKTFVVEREISGDLGKKIQDFREQKKISALYLRPHFRRIYPYQTYAGQVIGFVNYDNKGISGIELKYDSYLTGIDGVQYVNVTPKWIAWENLELSGEKPVPGADVYLTIDLDIQSIAEEELQKAVSKYHADGGMVVVMKPDNGEILAIASVPRFDPNQPSRYDTYEIKNRAITDIYEPGSTFKPVVAAAILESGKITLDSLIFCENGLYQLYKTSIRDHEKYGWLTFQKVIANSSNIGMIKATHSSLNGDRFYQFLREMGFGSKTGIELPGEAEGILHSPKRWSGITMASMSFGHEIGVTAIQMATAFSTIANSGEKIPPVLVQRVVSPTGKELSRADKQRGKKIFSKKTSENLKKALQDVVETGTGKWAAVENLPIAGKTGTAQKLKADGRGYSDHDYVASFIGFFPVDHPVLTILVMLDDPKYPYHTGGTSAAPTFRRIVEKIVGLPGYARLIQAGERQRTIFIPDFTGKPVSDAKDALEELGISYRIEGDGKYVISQSVKNARVDRKETIILHTGFVKTKTMPDLKGKSLKEVIAIMNQLEVPLRIVGNGVVVSHKPEAGTVLDTEKEVEVICRGRS